MNSSDDEDYDDDDGDEEGSGSGDFDLLHSQSTGKKQSTTITANNYRSTIDSRWWRRQQQQQQQWKRKRTGSYGHNRHRTNNSYTSVVPVPFASSATIDTAGRQKHIVQRLGKNGTPVNVAWQADTRAMRIMGNVRISEERSRQLLLCEEAGGGELCRMLFKGHLVSAESSSSTSKTGD